MTAPPGPGRETDVGGDRAASSTPSRLARRGTIALANGSVRPSSRSPRSTTVTEEPSAAKTWAISHATTPPPRTTSRPGDGRRAVASMLVHGLRVAQAGDVGGTAASCRWRGRRRRSRGTVVAVHLDRRARRPGGRARGPGRCPPSPARSWPRCRRSGDPVVPAGEHLPAAPGSPRSPRGRAGRRARRGSGAAAPWRGCTPRSCTHRPRAGARRPRPSGRVAPPGPRRSHRPGRRRGR